MDLFDQGFDSKENHEFYMRCSYTSFMLVLNKRQAEHCNGSVITYQCYCYYPH
jgi:hypothetical protein